MADNVIKAGISKVVGNASGVGFHAGRLGAGMTLPYSVATNIAGIAGIDWATRYNYIVHIDKIKFGKHFVNGVVPARTVSEFLQTAITKKIELPMIGSMELPVGRALPQINMTMYDTDSCEVETALRNWASNIYEKDAFVGYLDDVTAKISIYKLNHARKIVMANHYMAFPVGDINIGLGSENGLKELQVNFQVVRYLDGESASI